MLLVDLPRELVVHIVARLGPREICRTAGVSKLFHDPPDPDPDMPRPLAEEAIRLWAQERGYELPAQPEHENCAVRWLCRSALVYKSNADCLAVISAEVEMQRETNPGWRMKQRHVIEDTPWGMWHAGKWVAVRRGNSKSAVSKREKMTPGQLEVIDNL